MELKKVFKNLKVIELAGILAGPLCGKFFAELGAKVIKIENKNTNGEATRKWKNIHEKYSENISSYYAAANYSKQSLFLNLKDAADYQIFLDHLKDADVIIANSNQEKAKKLKIDFDTLKQINNKIIYANIIGYKGNRKRPAFDAVLQAESGYINLNGKPNESGYKIPFAFIDVFANHQLREAILIALLNRKESLKAQYIEVSLFQSAIASLINQASNYLSNNVLPKKLGSLHPNIAPYGEIFKTSDGAQIIVAVGTDVQFQNLLKVLGLQRLLKDPKFISNAERVKNRTELEKTLADEIAKLSAYEVLKTFEDNNVPAGLIANFDQVFEKEEAQKMVLEEEIEGKLFKSVKTVAFNFGRFEF